MKEEIDKYTIEIHKPETVDQLWGAWCEELKLSAFGETENEAFYNLVENIPIYFEIKNEKQRLDKLRSKKGKSNSQKYIIPAFA